MKKLLMMMICAVLAFSMLLPESLAFGRPKEYPSKSVEITVPVSPGGGPDLIARAIAEYLTKEWGKPVVVVNKPGGSAVTGLQSVLSSRPDGYSVCTITSQNSSMQQAAYTNPPFKLDDEVFIARTVADPIGFIVNADAPWKNVKEFSKWAVKNPDKLIWTNTGTVSTSSFAAAEWYSSVGGDITKTSAITTTSGADSAAKIAGGHALINFGDLTSPLSLVNAGKLRYLAISSPKRSSYFPNVPTCKESGIKGLTVGIWHGIVAPKGTPKEVIQKWNKSLAKMFKDPKFIEKLRNMKVTEGYMNSKDFTKFVKDESVRYTNLATKLGIRK